MSEGLPRSKPRFEKVPVEGEEYLEHQKIGADYSENRVFGSNILMNYHVVANWNDRPAYLKSDKGRKSRAKERLEQECQALSSEFKNLLMGKSGQIRDAADAFIKRGLSHSKEAESSTSRFLFPDKRSGRERSAPFDATEKWVGAMFSTMASPLAVRLEERIVRGDPIPGRIWGPIVEGNERAMRVLENELREKYLPRVTADFISCFQNSLGRYHLRADEFETILLRLNTVAVQVVDGLSAHLESIGGTYRHANNQVFISAEHVSEKKQDRMREILTHEFLHLLSGRLVYKSTEEQESEYVSYRAGRIGLRFSAPSLLEGPERFRWLNEAVTERLTIELSEYQNHQVQNPPYQDEMGILEFLCTRGSEQIPFESFVQAYFENYKPEPEERRQTIPAWRLLREAINRGFNPKFLIALDDRIKKVGSKRTLSELESGEFKTR